MSAEAEVRDPVQGDGYALGNIEAMGDGYGFRKIRRVLDVKEVGVNAIVLPGELETGFHYHDEQEELYFVHSGRVEIQFGDGHAFVLGPGGIARVDAATHRKIRNAGSEDAVYVVIGAKGGYVGRDGRLPEGEERLPGPHNSRGG